MASSPNLDALIPREDFEVADDGGAGSSLRDTIDISSLEKGHFFYESLRKPDFQRETVNWSPIKVHDFIKTFLDGDLVPSIILWKSQGNTFVIDGAHRLSALIAWVQDDYGDGMLSNKYFKGRIEDPQRDTAEKTRKIVKKQIGSYADHRHAASNPDSANADLLARSKRLGSQALRVQWVDGDARKAEESFFKINQSATVIDATELTIIKARRKPNAIAARALIRAGTGHRYWSAFLPEVQTEIEQLSKEVYEGLFRPVLEYPIKTLDLPVAGGGYSADSVKMIFDLVNYLNKVDEPANRRGRSRGENTLDDDEDGRRTLEFLKTVRRSTARVFGPHVSSLGLHPGVYCYGATGRFQPTAFLAAVALVQELEGTTAFNSFTDVRKEFEEFLLSYRHFVNQIAGNFGSGTRGLKALLGMYSTTLKACLDGLNREETVKLLKSQETLSFLREITDDDKKYGRNFSKETKSAAYLREALAKELTCTICGARLHFKGTTVDHRDRKNDGGMGNPENAQLSHPYCNSGYKESKHAASQR